jgi:hypothetical protein
MKSDVFFQGNCPRCNKRGLFKVLAFSTENQPVPRCVFHRDEWRYFDFGLFSVATFCGSCKNFASAMISLVQDEVKNESLELADFADEKNQLRENENLIISFDVPVLLPPELRHQHLVADTDELFIQARQCYDLGAWDAVGMLCRRILDLDSRDLWRICFPDKEVAGTIFERLEMMLINGLRKERRLQQGDSVEGHLDFTRRAHEYYYLLDRIRENGNDANHSQLIFDRDDAESIYLFTERFLTEKPEIVAFFERRLARKVARRKARQKSKATTPSTSDE